MAKRKQFPAPHTVRETIAPEQVLAYFGIAIDDSNKCLCPFHSETVPSMQVNEDYVYCFGCRTSGDSFWLAKRLLERQRMQTLMINDVIAWFLDTALPAKTTRTYASSAGYVGDVPQSFVDYYQQCMTDELYQQLFDERLITKDTAVEYGLGWRPDWKAWAIPFYRGQRRRSPIDVLQFRLTDSTDKKYVGLTGHNRGTVMNADLLMTPQRYLIIPFGSFDSILAAQDGLIATGLNGSNPFKKTENDRVKELFKYQHSVFVVPDNSPGEVQSAYELADIIGGQVRFFDSELPAGTDYIDYRKLGYTAQDFLQDVIGIEPITQPDSNLIENILELWKVGDKEKFASIHAALDGYGQVAADVARELAKRGPFSPFTPLAWSGVSKTLWNVRTVPELFTALDNVSQTAHLLKTGAW